MSIDKIRHYIEKISNQAASNCLGNKQRFKSAFYIINLGLIN